MHLLLSSDPITVAALCTTATKGEKLSSHTIWPEKQWSDSAQDLTQTVQVVRTNLHHYQKL